LAANPPGTGVIVTDFLQGTTPAKTLDRVRSFLPCGEQGRHFIG